ncbi:MAG: hypothetical protein KQI62_04405 [Deltaproteobacteria bacterium]|nr:hypothetical protein [Deltaproteobacteria bacterium]
MPARPVKSAFFLLGALLLALIALPASAKSHRVELKLVFADGVQLVKASDGDLRIQEPGIKGRTAPEKSLSPGKDGLFKLYLRRPGKYRVKLKGIPIAEFRVAKTKEGLQTRGLSPIIKLPFTHVLEVSPPRQREKYTDPKTGKERTRSVYESIDWSKVWAGVPGKNQTAKLWPDKSSKYVAGFDANRNAVVAAVAPGCAPMVTYLRMPKVERSGDLARRKANIYLKRVSFNPVDPSKNTGVPGNVVHNVQKKVLWWWRKVAVDKKKHWYLLAYHLKTQKGSVVPLRLPTGKSGGRRSRGLTFYLDESGALHAYRGTKGPGNKPQGQCYRVQDEGSVSPVLDCIYPAFRFHGQIYGKGGKWFMPNIGGVPLRVGGNSVSVSGTVRVGQRTTSVSESYTITVEGPVPHVTDMDPPTTNCTGNIPSAHDDDNRLCLDPPVDPDFYKGLPPREEDTCPKPKNGCRGNKQCIEAMRACRKRFRKKLEAWQRYRPKPPCYGEMIKGNATFGGVSLVYAGPVDIYVATDFDNTGKPISSAKRTVILSGLPSLRPDNWLVDSSMGWGVMGAPLNLREGPYPELRYRGKRIDPTTRKQSKRYEVVKLYPWNYQVSTEGREIKINRSGILRPSPPPAEQKQQDVAGAYLEVVSPEPEGRHALTGPEAEVRIHIAYQVGGAPSAILKVSADHANGTLYSQSLPLPGPAGEQDIAFKVKQPEGSPQFGVGLKLVPAGEKDGPSERIYYHFSSGAFSVEATPERPVAAHPKNQTLLALSVKDGQGQPLANRRMTLHLVDPQIDWLNGGYLHHTGGASVELTTDAQGRAEVLYIPPDAAMTPKGTPVGNFPVPVELELRDAADPERKARASLELVSPWPRISKLALPSGDLAGHWQGDDSRVVISDADNEVFDITIHGPGEFGYAGGHGYQEKLEVLDATSPFRFRFKSRPMGLDLNDIPSDWDMVKEFGKTNAKVFGRLALLMGGNWLLKQHAVTGAAKTVSHTSKVTKTYGGASKVGKMGGRLGSDLDTTIVTKVKLVTKFENALPEATWATGMLGDADAVMSITKNTAEVMNAAGQSLQDAKSGSMGPDHDLDAALDGLHAGVGIVDTIVTFQDMINGAPMDIRLELLKAVYENAKTFYALHRKFLTVAESWEDITFLPILVEVKDREGHRARRLGRLGIKFSKEMGQQ